VTRGFIAVRPPDAVLDAVAARTSNYELDGARRTTREQWHLTLQFLGDDVDLAAVGEALAELETPPGMVQLSGAGPIDYRKRSLVLVLFARVGKEWLAGLADEVARRLAPLGYERDQRQFLAHLTLARCRVRTLMTTAAAAIGPEPVGDAWLVDHVTLFESRLLPTGAEHVVRAEIPLGP